MNIFQSYTSLKSFTHFSLFLRWDPGTSLCSSLQSHPGTSLLSVSRNWFQFVKYSKPGFISRPASMVSHLLKKVFPPQLPSLLLSDLLHSRSHLGRYLQSTLPWPPGPHAGLNFTRPVALWFFLSVVHRIYIYTSNAFLFQQNVRTMQENLHSFFLTTMSQHLIEHFTYYRFLIFFIKCMNKRVTGKRLDKLRFHL